MLPLMTWYGIEPLVGQDLIRASALAARCKLSLHRTIFLPVEPCPPTRPADCQRSCRAQAGHERGPGDILSGILEALRGRKQVPRPEGRSGEFAKLLATHDPDVVEQTLLLANDLGEPKAIKTLRMIVADRGRPTGALRALTALVERRAADLTGELHALLDDQGLRGTAIRPWRLITTRPLRSGSESLCNTIGIRA